nr:retrovirus-related Pol polyprotein from transposon TNT 1-94 [Tanacetum cinerariifolium]
SSASPFEFDSDADDPCVASPSVNDDAVASDSPIYYSCDEDDFSPLDEAIASDQRLRISPSWPQTSDAVLHISQDTACIHLLSVILEKVAKRSFKYVTRPVILPCLERIKKLEKMVEELRTKPARIPEEKEQMLERSMERIKSVELDLDKTKRVGCFLHPYKVISEMGGLGYGSFKEKTFYEDEAESKPKIEKKTVKPSFAKIEFVKAKEQVKSPRKTTVKQVLLKFGLKRVNAARPFNVAHPKTTMNAARPNSYLSKTAHSSVKMPIHKKTAFTNSNVPQKVNAIRSKTINSARPKVVVNAVLGNRVNVVKASACWVSKPKTKVIDHVSKNNSASITLKKFNYVDAQGKSKHMIGNMSFLIDYKEIDRGYVAFGGNPKGGKITGRCTIKIGKLDFENVYFAEAVNTTCYVQNRVLVVKPHNKTPYELFHGRTPALSFMRSFGCLVAILNTKDHLGKFDGKTDEGFFVGYSLNSKAFRVFNNKTRIVEKNLHIRFSENTPNIAGSGPNWIFDIDAPTKSIDYKLVDAGNQSNGNVGTKAYDDAGKARVETVPGKDYMLLPLWTTDPLISQELKSFQDDGFQPSSDDGKKVDEDSRQESEYRN